MKKVNTILFVVLCASILFGCSPEIGMYDKVTIASPDQMFYKDFDVFNKEDLIVMLDPAFMPTCKGDGCKESPEFKEFVKLLDQARQLHSAMEKANDSKNARARRTQIQDTLISASNQKCNLYKTYLKRVCTNQNMLFGSATTILGGAGAIVTHVDTARLLAGLAGISSGIRSELNQSIFESVTTSVIIPGIDAKRKEILKSIDKKRSEDIKTYTVQRAIADAIEYHGACTLDAGLSLATERIKTFEDVGLDKFNETQKKLYVGRLLSESIAYGVPFSVTDASKELEAFLDKLNNLKEELPADNKEKYDDLINKCQNKDGKEGDYFKRANDLDSKVTELFEKLLYAPEGEKFSIGNEIRKGDDKIKNLKKEWEKELEDLQKS